MIWHQLIKDLKPASYMQNQNLSLYPAPPIWDSFSFNIFSNCLICKNHYWTFAQAFSYKQLFFSTYPQCRLTFSWIELQMLLDTYNHHYTGAHFIFSMFVFISWPRSIFVVYVIYFSISVSFFVINHITTLKQRLSFLYIV